MIDSCILIKPSANLDQFLKKVNQNCKNDVQKQNLTLDDYEYIQYIDNEYKTDAFDIPFVTGCELKTFSMDNDGFLHLNELFISDDVNIVNKKHYLHEALEGSDIYVPEYFQAERNPELEKRCELLRRDQENKLYKSITKNVDNVRLHHPEDTIAYQMKQFNRQLIAVFQFIVSVITGFVFGFIGVELMVGTLDFGFRLLLGIMCALTIAIAELYFLAKQLNEV